MRILIELLKFLIKQKKHFLLPIVLVSALMGVVMALSHGTIFAPFIYTLF
jgi:hypothetical protein